MIRAALVVVLAGVLTLVDDRGRPAAPPEDPAREAVRCVQDDPAPSTYTIVVMLIAERDGLAVPGLVREIRRGVAQLDRARTGDRGLMAAAFALAARAEIEDDPAAAEGHLAAAAQLVGEAGPGAGSPAMVLGAAELARTAQEFGDPRAGDWLRQAVTWADNGRGDASPDVRALAEAELTGVPLMRVEAGRPRCTYDRIASLSLNPVHRPTSDDAVTAALLGAVSPRRS